MRHVAPVLVLLGGCFAPNPHAGSPCIDTPCPVGLVCSQATFTCEVGNVDPTIDANAHDGAPPTSDAGDGGIPIDGLIDAAIVPVDSPGATCYGTGLLVVCLPAAPTTVLVLSGTLDTTNAPSCQIIDGNCVLAGTSITTNGFRVIGTRPVVLVATGSISVNGLDVASKRTGSTFELGAGANPTSCTAGQAPTNKGGGTGGTFGGKGGNGGRGEGALRAAAANPAAVAAFRGGCAGGNGQGQSIGLGGPGGGAVYLIAESAIQVNGALDASGAGGTGARDEAGGGGGGSGGMVGLDAPSVTIGGIIFANGGGGGEGAGQNTGDDGQNPTSPTVGAPGGAGGAPNGGDGGKGSFSATLGGENGDDNGGTAGGGGGGGGAGVLKLYPLEVVAGNVAPPPS